MDANLQSHRYMRPPPAPPQQPPPMTDHYHHQNPYFHHHHQQQSAPPPPQQRPPIPQQGHQWYSNQFQYQPPPSSHSPSPPPPPPPPPPSQWAPPPASSAYPPPPPPPYSAHHYPIPPRPHLPPPPPPQVSHSYPEPNQDRGNSNWTHHQQGWDYTAQNNVQDWAARAKEWANARAAMDNQHMQSQYPQSADFCYADTQQQSIPASGYQQFPVAAAQPHQPPMAYQQENVAISSAPSSYGPDVHIPYFGRDGVPAGEAHVGFPHYESSCSSPSVHQQEVPSSYSSVTGTEENANQKQHMYSSFPMPSSSAQEGQPFAYGNQAADPPTDLSDQPLDFAPRFNHDQDLHMQSSYAAHHESPGTVRGVDPVAAVPSVNSWTPPVAAGVYPPNPHVLPAGPQHDPSISMASVPGPAAPQFRTFPGPGFQPTIPSASTFGIGAAATLHPTTTFPADVYGLSGVSERPKKAPVPNWLKEEIIKNKAAITKSSLENPKGEKQSIDDDVVHKSSRKGDQADSKSIDSSRSTEEEDDDDEDYVEAAKTAAINQEIKRILTEVLLKVTDELFDEIATEVLSEDETAIEINDKNETSNYKVSPPPPAIPTPKASAKVLVPVKAKESETGGASEKTSSSSPGDVLGLANYTSDDDGDDEIQSSSMPNSRNNIVLQSSMNKHSEYIHDAAETGLYVKPEKQNKAETHSRRDLSKSNDIDAINVLSENRMDTHAYSSNAVSGDKDNENVVDGSGFNDLGEKAGMKTKIELHGTNVSLKISTNDNFLSTETRMKSVTNDRHENRKSSTGKDSGKGEEIGSGVDDKGDQICTREDKKHPRKEKIGDHNGPRDKIRDEGSRSEVKAKDSKSRRRSTDDVREDRKDAERNQRGGTKEGVDKKRERSKEEDASRHKLTSDSGRHKKRFSSPISSKGRNSKENSISHTNDSSDRSSDDTKRKRHSRKRHSSPSPVRSSRRQVTRSPHSKHSQRRHSPYSSLETARGRRSRSRSPVRRQR